MGFMSGEFPGHSRAGIPLYSRNVLVHLELSHGARSRINVRPQRIQMSSYNNRRHLVSYLAETERNMLNVFRLL